MIVIDTNVVFEPMRAAPNEAVPDWFGRRAASDLHISAVTEAELRRGLSERDICTKFITIVASDPARHDPGHATVLRTLRRKPGARRGRAR